MPDQKQKKAMANDWKEPYEDDSVTLGPEEALRREIEKTKALKVERLQLKDTIEKLRAENDALAESYRLLEKKMGVLAGTTNDETVAQSRSDHPPAPGWAFFLLIFNITAAGALLFFLLI